MIEVGRSTFESGQATLSYKWKITNLQYHVQHKSTKCLMSPIFATPHSNLAKQWRILFYPRNPRTEFNNYSSVFLKYFGKDEVVAALEFSRIPQGCTFPVGNKTLSKQLFGPQSSVYGFHEWLSCRESQSLSCFTIRCQIFVDFPFGFPEMIPLTIHKKDGLLEHSSQGHCQDDFHQLFETELLADVTVTIGQQKKSLHKAILASRSDVFRAMFQHDLSEKAQNVVNIVDISLDVAMEMFRYIYTGKVDNIEKLPVNELLIAAEKYAIIGLKTMCEKTLVKDLNFDNALQYLMLASVHNSPNLKMEVMEFVVKYLDKFIDKPQFKLLDQDIVCELLSTVAKNKY